MIHPTHCSKPSSQAKAGHHYTFFRLCKHRRLPLQPMPTNNANHTVAQAPPTPTMLALAQPLPPARADTAPSLTRSPTLAQKHACASLKFKHGARTAARPNRHTRSPRTRCARAAPRRHRRHCKTSSVRRASPPDKRPRAVYQSQVRRTCGVCIRRECKQNPGEPGRELRSSRQTTL